MRIYGIILKFQAITEAEAEADEIKLQNLKSVIRNLQEGKLRKLAHNLNPQLIKKEIKKT